MRESHNSKAPQLGSLRSLVSGEATWFLLVVFAFVQFSASNHEITTEHRICPEHGQIVDADESQSGASIAASAVRSTFSNASREDAQHDHQHCLFASSRGADKTLRVSCLQALDLITVATQQARIPAGKSYRASLIYLKAPKHSPPLV